MRKEVYICDHCGAEFDSKDGCADMDIDDFDFYTTVDLCEKCYNEICKYVFDFCGCGK